RQEKKADDDQDPFPGLEVVPLPQLPDHEAPPKNERTLTAASVTSSSSDLPSLCLRKSVISVWISASGPWGTCSSAIFRTRFLPYISPSRLFPSMRPSVYRNRMSSTPMGIFFSA